jgi:hypothetical protein
MNTITRPKRGSKLARQLACGVTAAGWQLGGTYSRFLKPTKSPRPVKAVEAKAKQFTPADSCDLAMFGYDYQI